jgi:hypothetical protein
MISRIPRAALALLLAAAPLAAQSTPCHVENDGPNFNGAIGMSGAWVGIKFTPNVSFTADRAEVFTGKTSGTNSLVLYSHDATIDQPGTKLASGLWSMSPTNSWQGAQLSPATAVSAGTTYWIVWIPVGGAQASLDVPMNTLGQVHKASFDNGQSWSGSLQFNDHHWKFRLFGGCGSSTIYCTAKTNSAGCLPSIASSGTPSASAGSGYVLSASQILDGKSGVLFYGKSGPTALPFQGGTLCAAIPLVRTTLQFSGGAPPCGGAFAMDFNAWIASGKDPALVAGQQVNAQYWSRDPGFPPPENTSLTDAVEFTIAP